MENGIELLYEMAAVLLFCIALTLFLIFYRETDKLLAETKNNIYEQHVIYME